MDGNGKSPINHWNVWSFLSLVHQPRRSRNDGVSVVRSDCQRRHQTLIWWPKMLTSTGPLRWHLTLLFCYIISGNIVACSLLIRDGLENSDYQLPVGIRKNHGPLLTNWWHCQLTSDPVNPNLVGGFKHLDYFPFHIWDVILPIDELIFFKIDF